MINYEYRGGRVAGAPELKETQNGTPYLRFRLANDESVYNDQTQQYEKKSEHFITVMVWPVKRKGEMVNLPSMLAANLNSGNSVQVWGKFATRSWETEDGSRRSVEEFTARAVAIDTMDVLPWEALAGSQSQQQQSQQQYGQQAAQNAQQTAQRSTQGMNTSNAAGSLSQGSQGHNWGAPAQPGAGIPY